MTTAHLITDEATTAALGRLLAAILRPGQTVLLDGPVGAGKSHLARALIRARQGPAAEDVPSPTFTLVQTYDDPAGTEIWHADLYRLTDPAELDELGLDEAQDTGICLIEWPDRLDRIPRGAITVALSAHDDPALRRVTLDGPGMDRVAALTRFMARSGWSEAELTPLAADASVRKFFRLAGPQGQAVLMDDPGGASEQFVRVTEWLRAAGLGAPRILAQDLEAGLLLVQDLGDDLVARVLDRDPDLAGPIYQRITDLLVQIHERPAPDFLPPLSGPQLGRQVGLFHDFYVPAVGAAGAQTARIGALIERLHDQLAADVAPVLALRDFHAENLIWRGDAPLGLIDYQDAVACHPGYDLVSVLQDARRDVDLALEQACITRYLTATGMDEDRFRAAYALLGAQRNLRILGIFVRLCLRDGKPRYLDLAPRVWTHLQRDLAHPALGPLARILKDVPAPDSALIERIRRQCAR